MKVQVLRAAVEDIAAGRKFYDRQEAGVGDYFSVVFLPKSIHWHFTEGFIQFISDFIGCSQSVFLRVLDCRRNPNKLRKVFEEMD